MILKCLLGSNVLVDELEKDLSVLEESEKKAQIYAYCPLKMEF